jgi:type IV pilus assembly protein PilE
MIVVAIIGILATIAYPSYQDYVRKSRLADGKAAILAVQMDMEKFRANCPSYATSITAARTCDDGSGAAGGLAHASNLSPDEWYSLALSNVSAAGYTLTATARLDQQNDRCGNLSITVVGGEITAHTPALTGCW